MESIKVPRSEIKKFADPLHWLTYFPPIAIVRLYALFTLTFHEIFIGRQQCIRLANRLAPHIPDHRRESLL